MMKISSKFNEMHLPLESNFREFLTSSIWRYIEESLRYRLEGVRDELEDPGLSHDQDSYNKGRTNELRWILEFPQWLVDNYDALKAEVEAAIKEKEKENGR